VPSWSSITTFYDVSESGHPSITSLQITLVIHKKKIGQGRIWSCPH